MRSHLEEEIQRRRDEKARLTIHEATLQAIHAFGGPEEIGASFTPHGVEVRNRAGDVVLRVASAAGKGLRAAGRGIGRTVKWALIVFGVLLLAGVTAAVVVLVVFQDDLREAIPRPLYERSEGYTNRTATFTDAVPVAANVKEVRINVNTRWYAADGCAAVSLIAPSGVLVMDGGDGCAEIDRTITAYETGVYTFNYKLTRFTGRVHVEVTAYERA
jgi:hypothetical protein